MDLGEFFGWSCLLWSHLSIAFLLFVFFSGNQPCPCSTDEIFCMIDLYLAHCILMVHFQYLSFFSILYGWFFLMVYLVQFNVQVLDVHSRKCKILGWWYHSFPVFKTVLNNSMFICFIKRGAQSIVMVLFKSVASLHL